MTGIANVRWYPMTPPVCGIWVVLVIGVLVVVLGTLWDRARCRRARTEASTDAYTSGLPSTTDRALPPEASEPGLWTVLFPLFGAALAVFNVWIIFPRKVA